MSSSHAIHVLARAVICDHNYLLLCQVAGLETSFYFLPGGHVEYGESAEEAVLRELQEEIGTTCQISRFLGVLEHKFTKDNARICHDHEYNFIFEAHAPTLKQSYPLPQLETGIQLLQWISLEEIEHIDLRPALLKTLIKEWLEQDAHRALRSQMDCKSA